MKSKLTLTLLFILTFSQPSFSCGNCIDDKTITEIVTYDDFAVIEFSSAEPSSCSYDNRVVIENIHNERKSMYLAAMTAAALHQKVSFKVNTAYDYENIGQQVLPGDTCAIWDAPSAYRIHIHY